MEKKEIQTMRYILDGSDTACLSRTELLLSEDIQVKTEKHFRKLFLAFYQRFKNQKSLGFVFSITYLDTEGKIKVKLFNENQLEKIDKNYIIHDCSIFMVYNKDEKTEDYFINNSIISSAELLKKDYKIIKVNELKRERNVKKVNLGKNNNDSKKKIQQNEKKMSNLKNNKNVTRVFKKQSSSIMNFFSKK